MTNIFQKFHIVYIIAISLFLTELVIRAAVLSPGGSDYGWFNITCNSYNPLSGQPCTLSNGNCREPWGIIPNYHKPGVRNTVLTELRLMFGSGQRRLRIPLYFGHDLISGTVLNCTGGLSDQAYSNMKEFLDDVKSTGFVEFIFGFFPIGEKSDPIQWKTWNEDMYQENWNVIVNVRKNVLLPLGLLYRIDLQNEGAPTPSQNTLQQYTQRLWTDYCSTFGKSDTLGFSIIPEVDRYTTMVDIYDSTGHGRPYLYDLHFYRDFATAIFLMDKAMEGKNDNQGWIIGETYYNSPSVVNDLKDFVQKSNRTIFWVSQWPLSSNGGCDNQVNLVPIEYSYYPI